MLEELLTREDCANCKICCKFEEDELMDAPVFSAKQVEYIKNNIDNNIEFENKNGVFQIKLKPYHNKYICPLLSDKGCILPNEYRPFDCESWPFYIMKKGNTFVITKSNFCPVFNKISKDKIEKYIERKFLDIAKKIIAESPEIITEYNRDLEILYEIK